MIIKKITLENIRSYKQEEIEFSKGSVLLSGDIGSGKTSVLLGIEFALFGLQPGQRGTSLLRNGANHGSVLIEFEVDGKEISIERSLKRGKSVSQDYCSITIDGVKKESSVMELKNKVLELLNYPKDFVKKQNLLYKFTIYTPQEEMKQIILQDPESRIDTLRHVFGIDKYKKIIENASLVTVKLREEKKLKEAMTSNLENDKAIIITKEEELGLKKNILVSVEKDFSEKTERRKIINLEKDDISKKIEEKKKLQQEIEKSKIMILNKNDAIASNEILIKQLTKQISDLSQLKIDDDKISNLEKKRIEKRSEKQRLSDYFLKISSQINSLETKNEENKASERFISNLMNCPTCLQDVDSVHRANVLNKIHTDISENKNKLETLYMDKKEVSENLKNVDSEIISIDNEISDLKLMKMRYQGIEEKQIRLNESEKLNLSLKNDISFLTEQIDVLNSSIFELRKFDNIFEIKQKEFDDALKDERLAEIKVAELKKEIYLYSDQIQELKLRLKTLIELKKQLDYITTLEDWLSKKFIPVVSFIEKNVMIKLKTEFSKLFGEWFNMLVSDSFEVRLDDNFTPVIQHQDYEIDYAYLSGGERTAVALAYRLSLNQVINSLLSKIKTKDLVILDEPTDGFSDQQLDKMRDVLQQLNLKQLIIVSHEQKIESFVENILRFKKKDGISFIEK